MNAAVRRIPSIAGTRSKLWKFLESLEPTCKKVHARMKAILEQEEVTVAKHGLEAVAAKKAGAVAGSSKDLADGMGILETWAEQVSPSLLSSPSFFSPSPCFPNAARAPARAIPILDSWVSGWAEWYSSSLFPHFLHPFFFVFLPIAPPGSEGAGSRGAG